MDRHFEVQGAWPRSGFPELYSASSRPSEVLSRRLIASTYNWMHEQRTYEEVSTMAKKDNGHKEIKKGKESER